MAGVPGFEPGLSVLETDVLTVDTIPLWSPDTAMGRKGDAEKKPNFRRVSLSPLLRVGSSLRFLMVRVLTAAPAELTQLQTICRGLLVLSRNVVATLAVSTLQDDVVTRHNYSTTSLTVPAPTVRPPSRMAKRRPFSIAIGAISSMFISTLSPGITISTPVGR